MKTENFSAVTKFSEVRWPDIPDQPGVYVIYDEGEVIYVGMAGRNGRGSLRRRLKDHSSGQMVNMFSQYLYLARVQFLVEERISHPKVAKVACQSYIEQRCSFRYRVTDSGDEARKLEDHLKAELRPTLNS